MPKTRINSLKSLAMNRDTLLEIIRGLASGYRSLARSRMISMSTLHRLAQIPINQETAAVQHAAHIVKPADDVDVGNIDANARAVAEVASE